MHKIYSYLRLGDIVSWALAIQIILTICGSRLGAILLKEFDLGSGRLLDFNWYHYSVAGFAFILLLRKQAKLIMIFLALFIAILFHSYCNSYQPSLALGIPKLDYFLHDKISANFTFDQALLYLSNLAKFLPLAYLFMLMKNEISISARSIVFYSVALALLMQSFAAIWQANFDVGFLSAGSGTALKSNRIPALFEDGGASSVGFSLLVSALFGFVAFARISKLQKVYFGILFLLMMISGVYSNGRVFYLGCLVSLGLMVLVKIVQLLN
ncbi:MAG: hypothetical protein R3B45_14120 [Bdellovibrionota bacterium]